MNQAQAITLAGSFFPNYKTVSAFYITSDGQVFVEQAQANTHAAFNKKKPKEVFAVTRDQWESAATIAAEEAKLAEMKQAAAQ